MKNKHSPQQRQLVEELEHDKESTELTADSSAGVDGSSSPVATTPVITTIATLSPFDDQQAYENQFTKEPIGESISTYALFSSGNTFTSSAIRSKTHYIQSEISGQLWLDVDGNGKRGSFIDSTLNAQEQDSGITGVDAIVLVDCDTDTEVAVTKSQPVRGDGEVVIQKVTETGGVAGVYRFPDVMTQPGRYYIVYKAPTNFSVNANVLPTAEKKVEMNADGSLSYFECPLVGGEGGSYYQDALSDGDFDYGGYCGRSVGCFEVGRKGDLEQKFEKLVELDGSSYGPDDMVVVYPDLYMLDVGLSQQKWPLATRQFAEIEVDLLFPENSTEAVSAALGETLESDSALAESTTVEAVQRIILESVTSTQEFSNVELEVDGVTISTRREHEKSSSTTEEEDARYLRASSRNLQESESSSATPTTPNGYTVVTYKFTARGGYNPPPFLQLGEIAEQSINADSRKLTKTLQDKIGDVFTELQTVNSKHMTVQKTVDDSAADEIRPPPLDVLNAQNAESRGLATWATVPIILLAVLISGLIGLFLFRRAFSRRKVVHHKDLEKKVEKKEQYDYEDDDKTGYADEEAALKRKGGDPVDSLVVVTADKAEEVPANMASSGTDGSSGNSEEKNTDSPERRRRRKPKSRKSRAKEFASSLKRSLTLERTESVLSDISDHEERRKRRKKAKEESRRRDDSEKDVDAEESSEKKSRRKSSRRSSGRMSELRNSFTAVAGDVAERRRKKRNSRRESERSSKSKSRRSQEADTEE